jgi:hypothetical protein
LPIPAPIPESTIPEGQYVGYIDGEPVMRQVTVKKGTPDEKQADVLNIKLIAVDPNTGEEIGSARASIFLYSDIEDSGSNWLYDVLLKALNVESQTVDGPGGTPIEMLPEPGDIDMIGKPIKFDVVHRTWSGRYGKRTNAEANGFYEWDGILSSNLHIADVIAQRMETAGEGDDAPW